MQCKMQIKEDEEDYIECDKCNNNYHAFCTTLDKRQFAHLLSNESEPFECHVCAEKLKKQKEQNKKQKDGNVGIEGELQLISAKLNTLDEIKKSVDFMSKQYDDLLKNVANNKKKIGEIEKENVALKNEVACLRTSVKMLNDVRVKNDCIVNGLKVEDGISAVDAVVNLCQAVGVDLVPQNIEEAFFINKRNSESQKKTVVVKCSSKANKDKLMSVKPKLKDNVETTAVYVNDFLSKETMDLLNYARALRNVGYRQVFARSGKVYCKKSEISRPYLIKDQSEVDWMLLNATSGKPWEVRAANRGQRLETATAIHDDDEDDVGAEYVSP